MKITLLTYSRNGKQNRWDSLSQYGIDVLDQREGHPTHANGTIAVGAVLIDPEGREPGEATRLIAEMHGRPICVLVACDCTEWIYGYLSAGADGVVSAVASPAQTANAIRSAYHQYLARQELCCQIETLKSKLEHRKLIGQAMGIIGELLGISESAALRRLRHEARNQRRPLHEVAQVVIETARLMKQDQPRATTEGPIATGSRRAARTNMARFRGKGRHCAAPPPAAIDGEQADRPFV
jgi:AmiR/NasT family two-component response regulator